MLLGNRKLAAIIAGLLTVGATVILGAHFSVATELILTAITIEGTLAAGGIVTFKGSE